MANIIEYLKRIQPVHRRSSNRMKLIMIGFILFGSISLFALQGALRNVEANNTALQIEAAQLEQENNVLQGNIDIQGSVQSVEQIARDELGLVDPDTVLIQPGD